ncbi:MAG: hypothetical protein LBC44_01130 [Mycoplasmataceae bacterium]|nr:hypothetical protein [Mycoplasmataceae bacterium]
MKTPYSNINDILKDLTTEFNEIQFKFRGHDYDISRINYNFYDKNKVQISFWKLPCFMVIKSERDIKRCGVMDPEFRTDYPANKTYDSWIELLEEYKIDGIPLKDVLCSDEVDIYWWDL